VKLGKSLIALSLILLPACSGTGTGTGIDSGLDHASDTTGLVTPSAPSAANTPELPTPPKPITMGPGNFEQTILSGGIERQYIVHVPQSYDGTKAMPLLFVLHGHGGTAKSMVKETGLNKTAEQKGFIVAYLQGTLGADGGTAWNVGFNPDANITADDVGFVRDLSKKLGMLLKVDAQRIYAAGFSNGGMMSHRLGSELSDVLAGVAVVEGTVGVSLDGGDTVNKIATPSAPIPIVMVHGLEDNTIPYNGGMGAKVWVESVTDSLNFWTTADSCGTSASLEVSPDFNVMSKDYKDCADGSEVKLYTVVNGHHEWPTQDGNTHFSASDAIWDFLSSHAKSSEQ